MSSPTLQYQGSPLEAVEPRRRDGSRARVGVAFSIAAGVVAALVAMLLTWCATATFGAGVSSDSVSYLFAGHSLAAGHGFRVVDGTPDGMVMTIWPPLYPTLLAVGTWLGIAPTTWARVADAALFGATAMVCTVWALRVLRSRAVAVVGAVLVAIAAPLVDVSSMVWSEALFTLWLTLALVALGAYLERPRWWLLTVAALLAGAADLTRYAGLSMILFGIVVVAGCRPLAPLRRRLVLAGAYGGIAFTGPALWALRNRLVSHAATPPAYASSVSLRDNLAILLQTLGGWVPPQVGGPELQRVVGALVVVVCVVVPVLALTGRVRLAAAPMVGFPLTYMLFMVVATTQHTANVPYVRYLVPMYPAFALTFSVLLDTLWNMRGRARTVGVAAAVVLAALTLQASVHATRTLVDIKRAKGPGYLTTKAWMTSPAVRALRNHPLDGHVISNFADVLIYRGVDARWAPAERPFAASTQHLDQVTPLRKRLASQSKPTYLVWFTLGTRGMYLDPSHLGSEFTLTPVAHYRDADVYELR